MIIIQLFSDRNSSHYNNSEHMLNGFNLKTLHNLMLLMSSSFLIMLNQVTLIVYQNGQLSITNGLNNFMMFFFKIDDIKTKGRDLIQPGADMVKEQMGPFRIWVSELVNFLFQKLFCVLYIISIRTKPVMIWPSFSLQVSAQNNGSINQTRLIKYKKIPRG